MMFDKRAYQREYMANKRREANVRKLLANKEAVVDNATHETREDLKNLSGGVESRHALKTDVRNSEAEVSTSTDAAMAGCNASVTARAVNADSGSSAPPAQNNLPVDVQPEPLPVPAIADKDGNDGEARQSNEAVNNADYSENTDCRGRQKLPKGIDPKEWAYACERAERARQYAKKMPEFIRPDDLRFQEPLWQYQKEARYRR